MKKDITVGLISVILATPVLLLIHIGKAFWAGVKKFGELQKEYWELVIEDFK